MLVLRVCGVLLALLLAGCGIPTSGPATLTPSPGAISVAPTASGVETATLMPAITPAAQPATLTPSPSAIPPDAASPTVEVPTLAAVTPPGEAQVVTATAAAPAPCAYAWAYQDAPGVPERARAALEGAGLAPTSVSAQVYGETCRAASGSVREFLAMGTTVTAELPVADLSDQAALGALVAQVTDALSGIGDMPGGEPEARLIFSAGGQTRTLQYALRIARQHIADGHAGADLLMLLGYQP